MNSLWLAYFSPELSYLVATSDMTRINLIPPDELSDAHLMAEYRELPRVRHAYPRTSKPDISPVYILGKGHVTFFYDKGLWLQHRHSIVCEEMRARGFATNIPELSLSHWPAEAMNDWTPSPDEIELSRNRITSRLGTAKMVHTWTPRRT